MQLYVTGFGKTRHLHKDKYLEIHNSIIQSVISQEGLKLHAYNSLQIYSYKATHCTIHS